MLDGGTRVFAELCHEEGISETQAENLFFARFGILADDVLKSRTEILIL